MLQTETTRLINEKSRKYQINEKINIEGNDEKKD